MNSAKGCHGTLKSRLRKLVVFLPVWLAPEPGRGGVHQFVFDQNDTAFSVTRPSDWSLDRSHTALRGSRYSAPGPGRGNSLAVWTVDGIPEGTYDVEFFAERGNHAEKAAFVVEHAGGQTSVTCSQHDVETGWHPLGTFHFTNAGRITQSDCWTGAGERILADGLRLTLHGEPPLPGINTVAPELTVVIDDLGGFDPSDSTSPTARLFEHLPEVTYAVIPERPWSAQVLEVADKLGIETILHQPCQFLGQRDVGPADLTRLFVTMTPDEIRRVLRRNISGMRPFIKGVNNHQGSRFSQHPDGLRVVMEELAAQKLYFCDSRTISDTWAYDLARQAGLLTAERDLFIDPLRGESSLDLILSVANQARLAPNLNYVVIGHQTSGTVSGLLQLKPKLQEMGVTLVPLRRNLHYIIESDFQPEGARFVLEGAWERTGDDMISHECHDGEAHLLGGGVSGRARFTPELPEGGVYRVFVGFGAGAKNTDAAEVTIRSREGESRVLVDQSRSPNRWHYVGEFEFEDGSGGSVELENAGRGYLRADCVKFVYRGPGRSGAAAVGENRPIR